MPKPATGKTPVRNARVTDEDWLPALARAEAEGRTASDAVTDGVRWFASRPVQSAYEFRFGNWPEASGWTAAHETAFARMDAELSEAVSFLNGHSEWLAIATWLASTHHQGDPAQQRRVLTGHILRLASDAASGGWRERYRDTRHLSETVQAILAVHLPLRED